MREIGAPQDERGKLVSFTVIRKPPAAFADEEHYAVCIVDLENGRRVVGRLHDFEPAPKLGSTVRTMREMKGDVPIFRPWGTRDEPV